ncbi:MAG: peptidylprolyl isomerase [Verrucomicrobia bacterium]|nr:peptidylprolyl isomerase [Verrucomicrobiota bacterium]
MKSRVLTIGWLLFNTIPVCAGPPVARFHSVLGNFDVLLDPVAAPRSVENFSAYANRGAYDASVIHRSTTYNPLDIQIVQGGGFALVSNTLSPIPSDPPILLEAGRANALGTLAMARTSAPDSATSQWFFNVSGNPVLDFNYAVFGSVLGAGQNVIEAIGAVPVYDASIALGPVYGQLPLLADSISIDSLVLINKIRVEPFMITSLTHTSAAIEIRWTALSTNSPVRVERRENLGHGSWTIVSSNNTDGIFRDTNAPTGHAFYRLVIE